MWKVGAAIIGLLLYTAGILGSVVWIKKQSYNHGLITCQLAASTAANDALEKALQERDAAYEYLQSIEDEIFAVQEGDDGVLAPVLSRELDRVYKQP